MKEQIEKIKENSKQEIMKCENIKELNEIKVKYLGKKGELTVVLRGMGTLSPEERPVIGSLVNQVRDELSCLVEDKEKQLKKERELLIRALSHDIRTPLTSIRSYSEMMAEKLEQENRKLAAMRDSLLPRLMSGEIDVAGIDI